jgi:hypothetical protein
MTEDTEQLVAAAANVLQMIDSHAELGRLLDLHRLRACDSYQLLAAKVKHFQNLDSLGAAVIGPITIRDVATGGVKMPVEALAGNIRGGAEQE